MKKFFSIVITVVAVIALLKSVSFAASSYNISTKAPYISPSLRPIIVKYKQENYLGAMTDLEDLLKKEKNNTYAKYYLALCYTRLGFKDEAQGLYREVVRNNTNISLSHYAQKAVDCLDNPTSEKCVPPQAKVDEATTQEMTDIDNFIRSGKKIHPAAMDAITKERMERKLQEYEYIKKQQEEQKMSAMPTNEEIAQALNTLSKIGINPFMQNNSFDLAGIPVQNNFGYMNTQNNMTPEMIKMMLYNQISSNNIFSSGI